MAIKIRPGRPGDAPFLAWVMLMAGRSHLQRGIWDIIISQPEDRCLAFLELLAVTETTHFCHFTEFIVAEVDGRPASALTGYDPNGDKGETAVSQAMTEVVREMGLTDTDMAVGQEGLTAFLTCHPDAAEGAWIVECVATLPEFRRRGLVTMLMDEMFEKSRKLDFHIAQISFYIGNTPAQKAYEKCGFRYFDEKRHPDFEREIGCPGMVRLLRDL